MAKAKKKTTEPRTVIRKRKAVATVAAVTEQTTAVVDEAPAPVTEEKPDLSPRALIERAADYVQEALDRLDYALYALEDGKKLFLEMDEVTRHRHVKPMLDYVDKSQFGLNSLRDEIKIVLGLPKTEFQPKVRVDIPTNISAGVQTEGTVDVGELKRQKTLLALAMQCVAQREVMVAQAEQYLEAGKFVKGFIDQVDLQIARAEQGEPKSAA